MLRKQKNHWTTEVLIESQMRDIEVEGMNHIEAEIEVGKEEVTVKVGAIETKGDNQVETLTGETTADPEIGGILVKVLEIILEKTETKMKENIIGEILEIDIGLMKMIGKILEI